MEGKRKMAMILRLLRRCTGVREPARAASSGVSEPVEHDDLKAAVCGCDDPSLGMGLTASMIPYSTLGGH